MGLVVLRCPSCGAELSVAEEKNVFFCQYCGTRIENIAERHEYTHNVNVNQNINMNVTMDHSNEPNLVVHYTSSNPRVYLVIRVVSTGQKAVYMNGQTATYHLKPGYQTIVLKIGKINYNRRVFIDPTKGPVTINAGFLNRAQISIDQPPYSDADVAKYAPQRAAVQNGQSVNSAPVQSTTYTNTPSGLRMSGLAIAGFVLSLTFFLGPVGLVMGIIDLAMKNPEKRHGLAIPAIIIGGLATVFIFMSIISSIS